jgi:hypothetical protein
MSAHHAAEQRRRNGREDGGVQYEGAGCRFHALEGLGNQSFTQGQNGESHGTLDELQKPRFNSIKTIRYAPVLPRGISIYKIVREGGS